MPTREGIAGVTGPESYECQTIGEAVEASVRRLGDLLAAAVLNVGRHRQERTSGLHRHVLDGLVVVAVRVREGDLDGDRARVDDAHVTII